MQQILQHMLQMTTRLNCVILKHCPGLLWKDENVDNNFIPSLVELVKKLICIKSIENSGTSWKDTSFEFFLLEVISPCYVKDFLVEKKMKLKWNWKQKGKLCKKNFHDPLWLILNGEISNFDIIFCPSPIMSNYCQSLQQKVKN